MSCRIVDTCDIGISKRDGIANTDKTRGSGLEDSQKQRVAVRLSPSTNRLQSNPKRTVPADRRKKPLGMYSNRAIHVDGLNSELMEEDSFISARIEPFPAGENDLDGNVATRDKPSRLHVDDIITIPTKLTIYMAYQGHPSVQIWYHANYYLIYP